METDIDKRSSLLRYGINYVRENFNNKGPRGQSYKLFMAEIYGFSFNKLECLSMASLSRLV